MSTRAELEAVISMTARILKSRWEAVAATCGMGIVPFWVFDMLLALCSRQRPWLLNVLAWLSVCWVYGTLSHITLGELVGEPRSFSRASALGRKFLQPVFHLYLFQAAALVVGLLCAVVPGVVFWVLSFLALPVLLFETGTFPESLGTSAQLARERWRVVLALGGLLMLCSGPILLVSVLPYAAYVLGSGVDSLSPRALELGAAACSVVFTTMWVVLSTISATVVYARAKGLRFDASAVAAVFD